MKETGLYQTIGRESLAEKVRDMNLEDYYACQYFGRHLPEWEKLKPEAIIIAPQAATVYQPLIKKMWQGLYNFKTVPKFFNIDPNALVKNLQLPKHPGLKNIYRALIFDDSSKLKKQNELPTQFQPNDNLRISLDNPSLINIALFLHQNGVKEIWMDWGKNLWHPGSQAILQRKVNKDQLELVPNSNRPEALRTSKKMRELADLTIKMLNNKII